MSFNSKAFLEYHERLSTTDPAQSDKLYSGKSVKQYAGQIDPFHYRNERIRLIGLDAVIAEEEHDNRMKWDEQYQDEQAAKQDEYLKSKGI